MKDGSVASRKYRKDAHGGNKAAGMFIRKKAKVDPAIIKRGEYMRPNGIMWDDNLWKEDK
jgi:hypothetical protein